MSTVVSGRAAHHLNDLHHRSTDDLIADFVATRDPEVREEVQRRHTWLARACAQQLRRHAETIDELEHVAMIGIYRALERFDPSYGVQFKTYASVTATGELRRHYRDAVWSVRVPRRVKEMHLQVQHAVGELTGQLSRRPTVEEIARWLQASPDAVREALDASHAVHARPLTTTTTTGGRAAEGARDLADAAVARWLERAEDRLTIRQLFERLDQRKRRIIALRFFAEMTQQEIAAVTGTSQVQVSRLIHAALSEMRAAS